MSKFNANRCDFQKGDYIAGKYKVEKVLGEGSFGVVFKVKSENGVVYALKLLRLWDVHPDIRKQLIMRFDMEYITGKIPSRYLVQALDHGITEGNPYIVMEYCPKGDIFQLTERQNVDLAAIGRQILYGLKDLHSYGKVHRDLKPENVLIKKDGTIALTDFGISGDRNKRMTEQNWIGKPTQIFGTYAYMPPEQVKPKRGDATVLPTTDIFSFGVMMYQLITRELPFGRLENENDLALYVYRGSTGDWNRTRLRKSSSYDGFERIIEGCLEPDYKKRLQTADTVLSLLPANRDSVYEPIRETCFEEEIVNGVLLRIMQGEEHGKIYKLNDLLSGRKRMLTIGRIDPETNNSIPIVEEQSFYISRKHCTLEWKTADRVWFIRDGQKDQSAKGQWKLSTNGTFVNSREVSAEGMYFYPGDIISIGDTKFRAEGY
ncbi:MAG: protein kinase [Dysgonamonadaceae bacterium]|jgi:serine/threonine protein kinase|nr:protein kinase [Dysgonamonadaceae bacterium]